MSNTTQAQEAAAAASAAVAFKTQNIGAATAVGAGFLAGNWIGVAGLLLGLAGFLVNWYFKYRTFKLLERKANVDNNISKCPPNAKDPD